MSSISEGSTMPSASRAEDYVVRKLANFHPDIWGDYFLNYTCDDVAIRACADEVEILKEEVRNLLNEAQTRPSEQLLLIDAIQRLSISFHFEAEIEEAMKQMYDHEIILSILHNNNLHDVALCFRLLRQQGYDVSSGKFISVVAISIIASLLNR
ncbi:hypothetical protein Scep_013175 [Stephania cephalantha]|uniref:Terpene synthase N-terminal domain-containing protein n=1 Tax=Stephania cephalantha TaxID=152367 RepID=A0AAP0JGX7_9MAGN